MAGPRGPIFLVGFMGAGKSTAGRSLARLLGWDFVDLDERIVEAEGRGIPEIFGAEGEAYFRRRELEVIRALRGRARLVVACGGGTYAQDEARALIDAMGRAVWLRVPLARALARCGGGAGRPLLQGEAQAEALYARRLPSYRRAPLQIDVEGLGPDAIAERIAALL